VIIKTVGALSFGAAKGFAKQANNNYSAFLKKHCIIGGGHLEEVHWKQYPKMGTRCDF
jgi:hypothetical protein